MFWFDFNVGGLVEEQENYHSQVISGLWRRTSVPFGKEEEDIYKFHATSSLVNIVWGAWQLGKSRVWCALGMGSSFVSRGLILAHISQINT